MIYATQNSAALCKNDVFTLFVYASAADIHNVKL